jgi:hypothetical protein
MKPLPSSDAPLFIRTDFSSDATWSALRDQLRRVHEGIFLASLTFVDEPDFANLSTGGLRAAGYFENQTFAFFADGMTMTHPEHPVLVVFMFEDSHVEFRAIPSEIAAIENNLSLANMDPEDFAEAAGADGIFRGF